MDPGTTARCQDRAAGPALPGRQARGKMFAVRRERLDYAETARLAHDTLAILAELLERQDYDDRMVTYARMAGTAFRMGDTEGVRTALEGLRVLAHQAFEDRRDEVQN